MTAPRRRKQAAGPAVRLLSGGNPQIAKGDGDAPVRRYIAAMPGWKRAVGERLDALIAKAVPGVQKAVKWNSPFYGVEGRGWFLAFHVLTRYVKVTFFRGTSLRPVPPGPSKDPEARYLDIHEDDAIDEARFVRWVKQAAKLPGYLAPAAADSASARIDRRIRDLGGWRGETLARMRALIRAADPRIVEEWKWDGPVWSADGIICTGEAYAKAVKLTFAKGARLPDPKGLFNSSLGGNTRRAIDLREGERIDARAFTALIRAAVAANRADRALR